MELTIFARFHAQRGKESAVAEAVQQVVGESRQEPGCLGIQGCRATRDPQWFFIHSRWVDEAAFELHATLPHTVRFLATVDALVDTPREVMRTREIA
ncbi:MAG TPA: antibiotic biosynthesis monooxygenase family protein [bacterium]|nr:antibiotic biosynthesis monooxygenase family protein [bacterium]